MERKWMKLHLEALHKELNEQVIGSNQEITELVQEKKKNIDKMFEITRLLDVISSMK